jgi:uncharacterized protein with von Willebrand factor type A (vWA) domain
MDAKLVEFCHALRANGIRVSISEVLDGLRAVARLGIDDRETVRATLRATTVKRGVDVPVFDSLFDLFFSGLSTAITGVNEATAEALDLDPEALAELLASLERLAEQAGIELSDLAQALLEGDVGSLERMLRAAAEQANVDGIEHAFQEGRYVQGVATALGAVDVTAELTALREALGDRDDPEAERIRRYLDRRLQDLRELLRATVRRQLEARDVGRRERPGAESLAEKSFFYLTEDELRRMEEAVVRLARRLRNVVAVRRRHAKRGAFDSSATLRRNLQYGGVPFKIVFERKRRERPQVVVLCDVSDSVRNVSRFMLQFVYALQDLYTKVRSFIFVAELGEVTDIFQAVEPGEALERALSGHIINVYAHSDFGKAFRAFHRDHLGAITKRTTVIILGDARNNYNVAHEWVLRDIQQRAKQVLWLNPENRSTWGFGDSEMDRYGRYCTMVEECRNLRQLYAVVDRMVAV